MSLFASSSSALARKLALIGALAAGLAPAAHAVTFAEIGDAGQTQTTAQFTTGAAGALTSISGSLSSATDVDLYVINITNPGTFSATTLGTSLLDTQIFVLTTAGAPVLFNDDDASGLSVLSTLPSGSFTLAAGRYIIGVAESGYNPMNSAGQLLFGNITSPTAVYGPASGLQPAFLGGYSDQTYQPDSGAYTLSLTGAAVAAVPEPSTYALMLLGVGALAFAAKRRRGASAAV